MFQLAYCKVEATQILSCCSGATLPASQMAKVWQL